MNGIKESSGRVINSFEKVFAFFGLLFALSPGISIITGSAYNIFGSFGNLFNAIIMSIIYGLTTVLLLYRKKSLKKFVYAFSKNKFLLLFILFATVSILWSYSSTTSLIRVASLFGATIFGFYFAISFNKKERLDILASVLATILFLSLFLVLFLPPYGFYGDYWKGVFDHKNELGQIMALASAFFLYRVLGGKSILINGSLFVFSLVTLYFANSAGALIIAFAGIIFIIISRVYTSHIKNFLYFIVPLLLILLFLGFLFMPEILNLMGRDETFTGRTELWSALVKYIVAKPFFGYGYYGFWFASQGPSSGFQTESFLLTGSGMGVLHAHNGFIEIMLDLGLVGVLLFSLNFLNNFRKSLDYLKNRTFFDVWKIYYLLFFLLYNLFETMVTKGKIFYWIIYCVVTFSLVFDREKSVV